MEKSVNVSIETVIEQETSAKVFARMCQLLELKGGSVAIPFGDYDFISDNLNIEDAMPDFFGDEIKGNIRAMNILETYLKEQDGETEVTNIDDLMGAVINPALCADKQLRSFEIEEGYVVFELVKI